MKSRAHYEKLFSSFPDVVTLPEFQSMLGGIGDSTARKIMRANKVKHFYIRSTSLSNNPKFQARFRVMSFVLAKNVYSLIKALYW